MDAARQRIAIPRRPRRDVQLLGGDHRAGFVFVAEQLLVGDFALPQHQTRHRRIGREIDFIVDAHSRRVALDGKQPQPLRALLPRREQKQIGVRFDNIDASNRAGYNPSGSCR